MTKNENIWVLQKRMAELFGCSADNFSLHLKNIYKEKEFDESATTEDLSVVQIDVGRSVVIKHLQNIFSSNELQEDSVRAIFTHTSEDGKNAHRGGKKWQIRSPNPQ